MSLQSSVTCLDPTVYHMLFSRRTPLIAV